MSYFKQAKDGKQRARELFTGGRASSTLKGGYTGAGSVEPEPDSHNAQLERAKQQMNVPAPAPTQDIGSRGKR